MGSNSKKRVSEDTEDYKVKRARNNEAVKRSREKSKQHAKETQDRVDKLKMENDKLRNNIRSVHKNLMTLKELFINATNKRKESIDINQVRKLLTEIDKLDTVESEASSHSDDDSSENEQD